MNNKYVGIFLISSIFIGINCNEEKGETKKITNIVYPNYSEKFFDLDSSLHLLIPNNWDSIEYLSYPSYEYKYYIKLKAKNNNEGIFVKRLKFKSPTLDLNQLTNFFKNEIITNPNYKNIHLIRNDFHKIADKNISTFIYYFLFKEKPGYLGKILYINVDSSHTAVEIETWDSDTSVSRKKNNYILNSIKIESDID